MAGMRRFLYCGERGRGEPKGRGKKGGKEENRTGCPDLQLVGTVGVPDEESWTHAEVYEVSGFEAREKGQLSERRS